MMAWLLVERGLRMRFLAALISKPVRRPGSTLESVLTQCDDGVAR